MLVSAIVELPLNVCPTEQDRFAVQKSFRYFLPAKFMTRHSLNNLKIHFSTFWRSLTIKLFVGTVNCKFHHICCVQEAITGLPKARFRRRCTHVSNLTPGGGGVLPYMGYRGMCRGEGYGFQAVYSGIGGI